MAGVSLMSYLASAVVKGGVFVNLGVVQKTWRREGESKERVPKQVEIVP